MNKGYVIELFKNFSFKQLYFLDCICIPFNQAYPSYNYRASNYSEGFYFLSVRSAYHIAALLVDGYCGGV
jgi:hypothetical protein